ncbi:lyase family protein [Rhizobium mongolense]
MGAYVLHMGLLKRIVAKLSKIANDFRLLSSGPHGGIGEIVLLALQPGSSLMLGKVNPVAAEALNQICFYVTAWTPLSAWPPKPAAPAQRYWSRISSSVFTTR